MSDESLRDATLKEIAHEYEIVGSTRDAILLALRKARSLMSPVVDYTERQTVIGWLDNLANNEDWTAEGMRMYAKEALEVFNESEANAVSDRQKLMSVLRDDADTDDGVRELCKIVFPERTVEGDSYGVPPLEHLTALLVARILQLEGKPWPEGIEDDDAVRLVKNMFPE